MNRRSALAALGSIGAGALTGCISTPQATSPDLDSDTDSGHPTVSLESQSTVPSEYEIEISVDVLEPAFTAKHPAKLQITTTNTGDEQIQSTGPGRCYLFTRSQGGSDTPPGLWLHDSNASEHIDRKDGKWVADTPSNQPREYLSYGCMLKEYAVGESVSKEYEIWADYQVSGYLQPGTYRWEQPIRLSHKEEPSSSTESTNSFPWWFTLQLETNT